MPQNDRIMVMYPRMHQAIILLNSNSNNSRTEITSRTPKGVVRTDRPTEVSV